MPPLGNGSCYNGHTRGRVFTYVRNSEETVATCDGCGTVGQKKVQWLSVMSNNAAVVVILKSCWCKDELAMHFLWCLFFWLATHQVKIVGKHLPGTHNGLGDALSHNNISSFMSQVPYTGQ